VNCPKGSILLGDKAYTNYSLEDDLFEMLGVVLHAKRRKNLKKTTYGSTRIYSFEKEKFCGDCI